MTLQKHKSKSSRSSRKPRPKRGSVSKGRQPRTSPKEVALAKVKDDLSKYLRLAVDEEIVITRHGRPAGILIGFGSEEDWFEYRWDNPPSFLVRTRKAGRPLGPGPEIPSQDWDNTRSNTRCTRRPLVLV